MSNKGDSSLTPTGTPGVNQTKRLSTIKTPGSPKALKTGGGGVKDVVSPGELCGFVCPSLLAFHVVQHLFHILVYYCILSWREVVREGGRGSRD
jgi:hypothetical protein